MSNSIFIVSAYHFEKLDGEFYMPDDSPVYPKAARFLEDQAVACAHQLTVPRMKGFSPRRYWSDSEDLLEWLNEAPHQEILQRALDVWSANAEPDTLVPSSVDVWIRALVPPYGYPNLPPIKVGKFYEIAAELFWPMLYSIDEVEYQ
jgi:hypothetical protein